jgi:hypothetical protein
MLRQNDKTWVMVHIKNVAFKITDLHVWFLVLLIDEQRVASIAALHGHPNNVPFINFSGEGKRCCS